MHLFLQPVRFQVSSDANVIFWLLSVSVRTSSNEMKWSLCGRPVARIDLGVRNPQNVDLLDPKSGPHGYGPALGAQVYTIYLIRFTHKFW